MKKISFVLLGTFLLATSSVKSQQVDYSVPYVQEETGNDFVKISRDNDYVAMPTVIRSEHGVQWLTNRILAAAPDGNELAYLSLRDGITNIFIKDVNKQGASRQRTNRSSVQDFSYSPDGNYICFTEKKDEYSNQLFITNAKQGFVCRQITSDSQDYSPIYSPDMKNIYFTRLETRGSSIWGYHVQQNFLTSYTPGMNPYPAGNSGIYVARTNTSGKGEIWKIDFETGVEECIISSAKSSFYSPALSPDGTTLLVVGETLISSGDIKYWNTDIYACDIDGTNLRQLTYHAADDLSPVWSSDGKYIYFISQRGSTEGTPNIWRMNFTSMQKTLY